MVTTKKCVFFILLLSLTFNSCVTNQDKEIEVKTDEIIVPPEEKDKMVEKVDYHDNGQLKAKGFLFNGKRMGLWTSWYDNGLKWSETTFLNNNQNGSTSSWYPSGILSYTGKFTNNKKSGFWVFYDESGKEVSKIDYDNPGVTDYNKQLRDTIPVRKK